MRNSSKKILKDMITSFRSLEQAKKCHMERIAAEKKGLQESLVKWETAHQTFNRLENMDKFESLWGELLCLQKKLQLVMQEFLDLHPDLKDDHYFLEATELLQEQKAIECPNSLEMKNQSEGGAASSSC